LLLYDPEHLLLGLNKLGLFSEQHPGQLFQIERQLTPCERSAQVGQTTRLI